MRKIYLSFLTVIVLSLASTSQVVINEVYGGGGNAGSTYKNDFIELYNNGSSPVSLAGWSVQYGAATGTTWQVTNLSGTIQAHGYYLVQEAAGAGGTTNLPTPDATGTINMSATAGKVALVNTTTALTGACPTGVTIIDFVGFGTTANCFEGSGPTPAPSNTTSVQRIFSNPTAQDTQNNSTDFTTGAASPTNSSAGLVFAASGSNASEPGTTGSFTINFSPATTGSTDVNYAFTGTATFGTDYTVSFSAGTPSTATASGTLQNIPASTSTVTVTITPIDDAAVEGAENITLTLSAPTAGYSLGTAAATINLFDDDVASTVSVAAGTNAAEPSTNGSFTLSFSTATTSPVTLDYGLSGTAGFSTDYSVTLSTGTPSPLVTASGTITIPSGVTTITLTVTPVNDALVEPTESIILAISNPSGGYTLGTSNAGINLTDDDVAPTVSVAAGVNAAEPSTNGSFTISFTPATSGTTDVNYSFTGTAGFGTDYTVGFSAGTPSTATSSGTLQNIPASTSSVTVTITTVDDASVEGTENITLTLSSPTAGYTIGTAAATINLTSDDIGPISLTGSIYSQDFNTLANSGTTNALAIPGWLLNETGGGARDNELYAADNGSSNTGDTYSYGTTSSTERALGSLQSGTLISTFGAFFINNTGSTVTSFNITYTGEQWRLGTASRTDQLDFQYSLDATNLTTGAWTDINQLDFVSPFTTTVGALDGNAPGNKTLISFTVTGVAIPNGSTFLIRWNDFNASGSDDGLSVDDFSIETNPVDVTPPVISTLSPANSTVNISTSVTATITFNENIQKGTGNIYVRRISDNVAVQTINVTTVAVTVTGNQASFNVTGLAYSTSYYIEMDAGSFADLSNNNFTGISGSGTWSFTTTGPPPPGVIGTVYSFDVCGGNPPDGFSQYSAVGPQVWACTSFGIDASHTPTGSAPNGLQINGFSGTNIQNEDWLISPSFDLTSTNYPLLGFWSRTKFNGLPLQLKVSTDYPGTGDPRSYTWTDLNGKFPGQTTDVWTQSSNINLTVYKTTNTHFAFVYFSSSDDGARWTLDDIQLTNSATPPPASLTISTTDIQFGYAAAGNTIDKTFTVTGNDITSDITITASSNFTVSANGTTFSSSVTLLQSAANNTPTIVYVRFSPPQNSQNFTGTVTISTTGVSNATVNLHGTSIDPATTLEVVNWNMEWFGSTSLGPANDAQQQANAQTILQNVGADLFGLVEVVDETRLAAIVSNMPGYAYVICNYGSHTNTNESNPTPLSEAQKEAFVYKTSLFSNITTGPMLSQGINSVADLTNPAYNYFASGRFPYMMTADVTLNGITKTIRFVLLHAKANTSPTAISYARRKSGSDTLHFTLNNLYPTDNIVLLGDINDDLDQTITDGITPPTTSYSAFTNDNTNFFAPTLALSLAGEQSTVSYSDMIDHVIVSNEMQPYYMNSTANVLTDVTSLVSNYASTTSDHYPVFTRYSFQAQSPLPVTLLNFNAVKQGSITKLNWSTSQEINSREFQVERSADGIGFTVLGFVTAAGNSSATRNYEFSDTDPLKGNNFYRLKMVDIDNKFKYSKIVKVYFAKNILISLRPNPAGSFTEIWFEGITNSIANVVICDINGKTIKQQTGTVSATQPLRVSLAGISKGVYVVKVITGNEIKTEKLVIQ